MMADGILAGVREAVASVDDPEYPGISIVEMGMVGDCRVEHGRVHVRLVPTFTGCPALGFIEADVRAAVAAVPGVEEVTVELDRETVWSTERLSEEAVRLMASDFTVAVARPNRPVPCPRCHEASLVESSMFGPTRCRAIHRCRSCGETVEVMRA